jgi:hypothetical protein
MESHAADGSVGQPFGDHPIGYLVYTADGHVFVQIMPPERRSSGGADVFSGTAEKCFTALGYAAYAGTFELSETIVVHHVEMSLYPSHKGTELIRQMHWDGDRSTASHG